MILLILTLLGAIALFVFGADTLSSGIQKCCGDSLRDFEKGMRSKSPLTQFLSGAGMTALIQSSSMTSYVVVSLVSAATLTLEQGISVIMGANVGTTITAWFIAVLGFSLDLTTFAFILVGAGFVLTLMKKPFLKNIGETFIGFALLFIGIIYMNSAIPAIDQMHDVSDFLAGLGGFGFGSVLIFLFIGILFTWLIRSSSVTVVLVMVLCFAGLLSYPMGAAIVLGANIGTTIQPNLTMRDANVQARRTALAHTVFNVSGEIIVLIFFYPFIDLCSWLVSALVTDPALAAVYGLAAAHTLFNLLSAIVLIWFRKPFALFLTKAYVEPEDANKGEFQLRFIGSGTVMVTPSISIEQAFKETLNFAETTRDGLKNIELALNENDPDTFEEYREKLVNVEETTDKFEYEIASFLNKITAGPMSARETEQVKVLYRIIGELESLGDSCTNISRHLSRLRVHELSFDEESSRDLNELNGKVGHAMDVLVDNMRLALAGSLSDISNAYEAEDDINETRNAMRDGCVEKIERGSGEFLACNYYLDLLEEFETMGDFMINVSQSLVNDFGRK